MNVELRTALTLAALLSAGIAGPSTVKAQEQEHIVSTADLRNELSKSSATRLGNLTKVMNFLSSEPARKAMKSAKIDEQKVTKAVPYLSDDELARLASRTDRAQRDLAAGSLSNEQLTYIVIALGAAVLVLILVKA
jgi:site-specific recombinase XerD